MILSNSGIHQALDDGNLIISPQPSPRQASLAQPNCPYDTCSVNLRLDAQLAFPEPGSPITFDLRKGGVASFLSKLYKPLTIDEKGGYALEPNQFLLGQTLERVHLPINEGKPCYAARIEGRSSFARIGLIIHFTAPTIHAGFDGNIALEIINLAAYPITLWPGMEICQLIIEQVSSTPFLNPSEFQDQNRPTGGRD